MPPATDLPSILALLRSLPPDENPYETLSEVVRRSIYQPMPFWFIINLRINSALQGIVLLFCLSTLAAKFMSGGFWVFRFRSTPKGTLLIPNALVLYCLAITCASAMAQVFIFCLVDVYRDGANPSTLHSITCLMFVFMQWAIWIDAWGLAVTLYLSAAQGRHQWMASTPAWALNVFFLSLPLIYPAVTMPLFGTAVDNLKRGYSPFLQLRHELAVAAVAWTPRQSLRLQPTWLSLVATMQDSLAAYMRLTSAAFATILGFLILTIIVFFPLAFLHCKALSAQMAAFRSTGRSTESSPSASDQSHLDRSYGSLIGEATIVAIVMLIFCGETGALAKHTETLYLTGTGVAITARLSLYAFTLAALPVHFLIARRICAPYYTPLLSSLHSSSTSDPRIAPVAEHRVQLPLTARWTLSHPVAPKNTVQDEKAYAVRLEKDPISPPMSPRERSRRSDDENGAV